MIGEVKIIQKYFILAGTRVPQSKCVKITTGHHGWEPALLTESDNYLLSVLIQNCSLSCLDVGPGGLWLYPKFKDDLEDCLEKATKIIQQDEQWRYKLSQAREHEFKHTDTYRFRQAS